MGTLVNMSTVFRVAPAFGAMLLCAIALGQVAKARTDDKEARDFLNMAILVLVVLMLLAGFMGLSELPAHGHQRTQGNTTQSHEQRDR